MSVINYENRVKDSYTGAPGTGNVTITNSAPTGFRTFDARYGHAGTHFKYVIDHGSEWEIGEGHLSNATTLVRDSVESSSNADGLVNFTSGANEIYGDVPASVIAASVKVLCSVTLHGDTSGPQALFTVPVGKHAIIDRVTLRNASGSFAAIGDALEIASSGGGDTLIINAADLVSLDSGIDITLPASAQYAGPGNVSRAGDLTATFDDPSIAQTVIVEITGYLY